MQGKILIVDAIVTNRIVLKIKLASAFFQVLQVASVAEALTVAQSEKPHLIICAFDMPDGSASDLCSGLAAAPPTRYIPVLAVGAPANAATRLRLLAAGAQDVLFKPLDDVLLLGRVRSLVRAHNTTAEWQLREDTSRAFGLAEGAPSFEQQGHIQLVSEDRSQGHVWVSHLRAKLLDKLSFTTPEGTLSDIGDGTVPDAFALVMPPDPAASHRMLRLISSIRANASTRHAGILVLQTKVDSALGANALDLGADDLMADGFESAELALRLNGLMRRKRQGDLIRSRVRSGLRAAVHDPLTGLHNRRYAMSELARLAQQAVSDNQPVAVMLADMDHFKLINDRYGHASGDAVLVETACRLRAHVNASDLVARIGGEEFLIVAPATSTLSAARMARNICGAIRAMPYQVPGCTSKITSTISIGICVATATTLQDLPVTDVADILVDQADQALYAAKNRGRNCVKLIQPAA